jgi:hypothetical protein
MDKPRRLRRIYEFTEFNLQRMNPDRGGMMPNVDDPQLSVNAFDKHQNAIQAATSKLNGILSALSNSSGYAGLKSKLLLDDQGLTSMKVLRIAKPDNLRYDVYLEFSLGQNYYHGVVRDVLGIDPKFSSEAFRDTELVITREWVIKTKGMVIKVLKKWMHPTEGKYKCEEDSVVAVNMKTGQLSYISKGTEIEVMTSFDNQIMIKHEGDFYLLQNDSFIYFNYWFVPVDKS